MSVIIFGSGTVCGVLTGAIKPRGEKILVGVGVGLGVALPRSLVPGPNTDAATGADTDPMSRNCQIYLLYRPTVTVCFYLY